MWIFSIWPGTVYLTNVNYYFWMHMGRQDPYHVLNLFCATLLNLHIWLQNEGTNKIMNKTTKVPEIFTLWLSVAQGSSTKGSGLHEKDYQKTTRKYLFYPHANKHGFFLVSRKPKSSDPLQVLKEKGKYKRSQRVSI